MTEALTAEWIDVLAQASVAAPSAGGRSGVVAVTIGKKRRAVLTIEAGRVVGGGDDDAVEVTVPTTVDQLASIVDGSESLARAYMRGDIKPVGSVGALLALIELFESDAFRSEVALATTG